MDISKKNLKLIVTLIFGFLSNMAAATEVSLDTAKYYVLHFKQKSAVIDSGYMDNGNTLSSINSLLRNPDSSKRIKSINISASSSPEGVYEYNIFVASKRTKAVRSYLAWKHPELNQKIIKLNNKGENWNGLLEMVESDNNVPGKEKVIRIIKQDVNPGTKKWRLQQVENGEAWKYMEKNMFKKLRTASTEIRMEMEKVKTEQTNAVTPQDSTGIVKYEEGKINKNDSTNNIPTNNLAIENVIHEDTLKNTTSQPEEQKPLSEGRAILAMKTNLAAYVFGVANLGIEIPFAGKMSVDIPAYYSPYTLAKNYKFRILGFEPELKYWFDKPFKGHAIGIHGAAVMYNIAFNSRDRFQNTNGENFVYGGGISYGYTMRLKRNWNIEFTAGLGYMYLDHDVFRNVKNGALYDNRKFHYWGPTKLGINIIYLFNKR